jgi:hypothetical protein
VNSLLKTLEQRVKSFAFRHTQFGGPHYSYNLEPIQLSTLINEIERLHDIQGNILEIGVARGMTTRFLCQHIVRQKLQDSLTFYAIDTYESFTQRDLDFEIQSRGKKLLELKGFAYGDYEAWKKHFTPYPFVKVIRSDCSSVDYLSLSPIKLSLLDVDLYVPTRNVLPKLYAATVVGGVILVDDVEDDKPYDGAYQAYMEFCSERNMPPQVIGNKCGVIHKIT